MQFRWLVLVSLTSISISIGCGTNPEYQPPGGYYPTGGDPGGSSGDTRTGADTDVGPGPTCSSSHVSCGNDCVDIHGDKRHCGECYKSCQTGQICSAGECTTLPDTCPTLGCPSGSVCDPTLDQCVAGCMQDGDCSSRQICEGNTCIAGCRDDTSCATGFICTNHECWQGCRNDSGCPSHQVCESNQCRDACFNNTDCPLAEVCYLPTNLCVPGCDSHDRCPSGQVCDPDTSQCRNGCLNDGECPGEICDQTTLGCRGGCRATSECGMEEICAEEAALCVPGCDDDLGCNAGRICDAGSCREGCRSDDDCADPNICDDETLVCREGCRSHDECDIGDEGSFCDPETDTCTPGCANSSFDNTNMSHRCPVDEACQENGTCAPRCRVSAGVECNPTGGWMCYWTGSEYPSYTTNNCRQPCTIDDDCPDDYVCAEFHIYWSDTQGICAQACDVAGCSSSYFRESGCACAADGRCYVDGDMDGTLCRPDDGYYGR